MPDGVVQWVEPGSGEAAVVRAGRVYPVAAREIDSQARRPGAHVHFDIDRDHGVDRAVHVRLRAGTRVSHRQPHEGAAVTVSTAAGPVTVNIVGRGDVTDDARAYAHHRIGAVLEHVEDPILFVRVKLTRAPDPARERPAIAQASIDINGRVVRAQVAGHEMREAIDLLGARLRDKLQHRAEHRRALRRRPGGSLPDEWRHGDPPTHRPDYFDRPADERQLVRHKTYVDDELTPDEAAFDMEQLDFDFYLFRDLASGVDAVLERAEDGSYLLTRLRPASVDPGPTALALAVAAAPAPELDVDEAIERIIAGGERDVFFANAATGRGNVIFHRYDGHYGLITPD